MKKFIPFLLSLCFLSSLLSAQQDPVGLCAQVSVDGTQAYVDIIVDKFTDIQSYQFGLAWENSKYSYNSIDNLNDDAPALSNEITTNLPNAIGLVRVVWFDDTAVTPVTLEDGTVLFTIVLDINDVNDMGLIGIAPNDDFEVEFSNSLTEIVPAVVDGANCSTLAFNSLVSIDDINIQDLKVAPNPFSNKLTINVDEALDGTVSIYNSTGKVVLQDIQVQGKEINLDFPELTAGSYILKYQSKDMMTQGQIQIFKM